MAQAEKRAAYAVGRTAGFFLTRMVQRRGSVLAVCHSFDYRAQADRISGFRDSLIDSDSGLDLTEVLQGRDEQELTEYLVSDALRRFPSTAGIYNAGGANRAVEQALLSTALAGKVIFIGHELTAHTHGMLSDGMMTLSIDQNPEEQARRAIDVMLHRFGYSASAPDSSEVQFTIHSRENLKPSGDEQ